MPAAASSGVMAPMVPVPFALARVGSAVCERLCRTVLRRPAPGDPPRRHQDLIEALVKGPAEAAAEAMREHNAVAMERTLEVLKPYFKMRQASRRTFYRSERKRTLQGLGAAPAEREVRYQNA